MSSPQGGYIAPPKPGTVPLRPLGVGELLDGSFQTIRRNAAAMIGSSVLLKLLSTIITTICLALLAGPSLNTLLTASTLGSRSNSSLPQLGTLLAGVGISSLLSVVLTLIIGTLLQGLQAIPVMRGTLNQKTRFGLLWRLAKPTLWKLILLGLFYAVALLIGMGVVVGVAYLTFSAGGVPVGFPVTIILALAAITLAVWVGNKIALAPAVMAVEGAGVGQALRRSWRLTDRNFWRVLGMLLLAGLIASVIGSIVTTPLSLVLGLLTPVVAPSMDTSGAVTAALALQAMNIAIASLVSAITSAFQTGVLALLYADLRIRKEGLDLQLLKELEDLSLQAQYGAPAGTVPERIPGSAAPSAESAPSDYRTVP
ncbi:glycerophosphoryl diester phosphodiesterase membrane domain-containing protein [Psychromicrobium xiongbiense]|uniref:glycerophosphoryl diester phosphodiesterase membrane domain-containing protein n=1 Tax=Psychromicrobium xiongbiense TaxID=3051184 RepID=UPI0025555478|nr:glycerophosphoryl diester phosphodiesterase membrane domain-containing protein [Psychromicrobium sp. YIM S02556]